MQCEEFPPFPAFTRPFSSGTLVSHKVLYGAGPWWGGARCGAAAQDSWFLTPRPSRTPTRRVRAPPGRPASPGQGAKSLEGGSLPSRAPRQGATALVRGCERPRPEAPENFVFQALDGCWTASCLFPLLFCFLVASFPEGGGGGAGAAVPH